MTRDQLRPATVVEHDSEPGRERRVRIEFDDGQLSWFDCRTLTPVETKTDGMSPVPDAKPIAKLSAVAPVRAAPEATSAEFQAGAEAIRQMACAWLRAQANAETKLHGETPAGNAFVEAHNAIMEMRP